MCRYFAEAKDSFHKGKLLFDSFFGTRIASESTAGLPESFGEMLSVAGDHITKRFSEAPGSHAAFIYIAIVTSIPVLAAALRTF